MANTDIRLVISSDVGGATSGLAKVQSSLGQVEKSMGRATQATQRMSNQFNSSRTGLQKFSSGVLQQAGYQVGDFAVQVANGTSKMQAFGQQGSQMLGIFGPWGAVLGAGVAIFSAFAVAAEKSGSAIFDFNRFATDLAPTLDLLRPILDRLGGGLKLLKSVAIGAINAVINGFQYLVAVVSAVPAAFSAALGKIDTRINSWTKNLEAGFYSARASMQEFMDFLTPGAAKGGFLGMPEETGKTAAENLRWLAKTAQSQADHLSILADEATGAFGTIKDAIDNVVAVDISDYFGKAAEAVAGDGGGGGNSLKDALVSAKEQLDVIADAIGGPMEAGLMAMIDGTKSVKDAFRDMARDVIKELYRVLVVQRIVAGIQNAISLFTGAAPGSTASILGGVRAMGGPVTAGTPYLVGEKGPEIVVPSRNSHVVPNNQLGGGGVTVNQNISFGAGVSRAEIQAMLPKIVETTKAAVFDAQRRSVSRFA